LLHEMDRDVFVALANGADELVDALRLLRARRFARRDEIVRDPRERGDDDDRIAVAPLGDDVDRVRDAISIANGRAAELDDDHKRPFAPSKCAFNSDAPAAPRIVLCTSATMRMSSSGHGRSRPTLTLIPCSRSRSSRV